MNDERTYTPGPDDPCGVWNAWVAAGGSREERRERLEQCPAEYRETVERHVRGVFELKSGKG